jgi:hypothetical protein
MRTRSLLVATVLSTALATPAVVTLPTLSAPAPRPRPVAPEVESVPLSSVDRAAEARGDGENAADTETAEERAAAAGGLAPSVPDRAADPELEALTSLERTDDFSAVGVTWEAVPGTPSTLTVVVRTHADGSWSDWQALGTEADSGDPAARGPQRAGTEVLWVGPSDGVQARVEVVSGPDPRKVRLELIDPGESAADGTVGGQPPGSAAAAAGQPRIYSRADWGADERRVRSTPTYMATIQAGVLHHTTDTNSYSSSQVPAMIRADYAYHLSRGWNDIGYNFLVDRFGRIWEGRRGGITAAVMGAHAGGFNTNTFGVAALGNLETARPSSAMITALARLFAWKLDLYHRDPLGSTVLTAASFSGSRYKGGTRARLPVIMAHRDVGYTACPGRYLYPYLGGIRSGAAQYTAAAITNPSLSTAGGTAGAASATVRAGTLTAQSYRVSVVDCYGRTVTTAGSGRTSTRTGFSATWNGNVHGVPARPGVYDLRVDSSSATGTARPWSQEYTVYPPRPAAAPTGGMSSGTGGFVPVTPTRLLDTRSGASLPLGPGGRIDVPVTGRAGIPGAKNGTTAVLLSVSAVCPSRGTFTRVWPTGQSEPSTSNLNTPTRAARTTTVVAPVGALGQVSLSGGGGVMNLVVDVLGYFSTNSASRFGATTLRVHDSTWFSGQTRTFSLPALAGIPAGNVDAVVATVAAVSPSRAGFVQNRLGSAYATVLNYRAGADEVNQVVLPVRNGKITLTNGGSRVRLIVDVVGVFTSTSATRQRVAAVSPKRAYDGYLGTGSTHDVLVRGGSTGVPADAGTVLVNLTAAGGASATGVTAWPASGGRPIRVDVYSAVRDDHAGMSWVPVGKDGKITVRNSSGSHRVIVDIVGYAR